MIKKLRELFHNLNEMYPQPHDHRRFGLGHHLRVESTITLTRCAMEHLGWSTVVDLSCGNGEIAKRVSNNEIAPTLGDFASGYELCGPIEETIHRIENHDVLILSETIEHVNNPLEVLSAIRPKVKGLILSTPIDCWDDDNLEHLWAWDREGVEGLLIEAGWQIFIHQQLDTRTFGEPYLYGIWVAT